MDAVPLNPVTLEVVSVETLGVVFAVQVGVEAVVKPPCAVVVVCTAVVVAAVVVLVLSAEGHAVMVLPVGRQGVAGVSMVTTDMKSIQLGLIVDAEMIVVGHVFLAVPVLHLDQQHRVT